MKEIFLFKASNLMKILILVIYFIIQILLILIGKFARKFKNEVFSQIKPILKMKKKVIKKFSWNLIKKQKKEK
jgi:hypothetical protein